MLRPLRRGTTILKGDNSPEFVDNAGVRNLRDAALDLKSSDKVTFDAFEDRNLPGDSAWMKQLTQLKPEGAIDPS